MIISKIKLFNITDRIFVLPLPAEAEATPDVAPLEDEGIRELKTEENPVNKVKIPPIPQIIEAAIVPTNARKFGTIYEASWQLK